MQMYNMEWREKLFIWKKKKQNNARMDERENLVRGVKDYWLRKTVA